MWDDEEDLAQFAAAPSRKPRLCRDIYESNVNVLLGDLRHKLSKVEYVRSTAEPGGDYEHTVTAYVRTLHAALDAAEKQFRLELERDQ